MVVDFYVHVIISIVYKLFHCNNPCPAELLQSFFSSFEAGIATKNITIFEK